MRYAIPLLLAPALAAPAQTVSFGAKVGAPVTSGLRDRFGSILGSVQDPGRWTVGPTFELHLKCNFSFEVDALYREYRSGETNLFRFGPELFPLASSLQQKVKAWDIPFLLKYRFLDGDTRPFFNIGISITHESRETLSYTTCLGPADSCYPPEFPSPQPALQVNRFEDTRARGGGVLGAGVEFRHHRIKIAPEIRYTRLTEPGANQVRVLVGLTF